MSGAHSLRLAFLALWLALALGVTAMLAIGGRPDPAGLGQVLDGPWRFHAGDNPGWAASTLDDRNWEVITLVSNPTVRDGDVGIPGYLDGWRARGHAGLEGYGWYRRQVTLPPHGDLVLLGPPAADDGYEVYWNGRRLGGVGRLSDPPRVSSTRPRLIALPASNGQRTASLAIRTFMQPGVDRDAVSGGLRTAPVLATAADGEILHRAQWRRWIAGYVVDAVEPLAMLALALAAVLAAPALARPGFARWTALALVASAGVRAGNAIIAWTDLTSLSGLLWRNSVILAPAALLLWTLAWNAWTDGKSRRLLPIVAALAWALTLLGALTHAQVLTDTGRALFAAALAVIAVRIARGGPGRGVALAALLLVAVGLFAANLSALGVPGIWFPFGIGVSRSQYAYALALPLLALALFAPREALRT